jgi:hypothetical protein
VSLSDKHFREILNDLDLSNNEKLWLRDCVRKHGSVEKAEAEIARLNDGARDNAVHYIATRGILSLDPEVISKIYNSVQNFKDFTEDNDPYGEHDFGSLTVAGNKVFWKIDYYNQELSGWCDPLSPDCRRILTIMLAEEY